MRLLYRKSSATDAPRRSVSSLRISRAASWQLLIGLLLSATTLISSSAVPHQSNTGKRLMLVVSKGLPGITVYDAESQKPICNATMGISPHEAAFSLDGQYAYVPVYGNSGVGKPGTDEHIIHFIRTSDCQEVGSLDTG
jgi:hypothetical protein